MGLLRGHWMPFLGGVVTGAAFVSTVTLIFWSISPTSFSDIQVAGSNRVPLSVNHLVMRQDNGVMGGDSIKRECICPPKATVDNEISTATPTAPPPPTSRIPSSDLPTSGIPTEADHDSIHDTLARRKNWKDNLLVGVVRVGAQLEWAESVLETWGREVSQLIFYNHGDSNMTVLQARALGLQLVELRPPATTTPTLHYMLLSVLSHMTQHFLNSHLWFLAATSHTYVHLHQLGHVLEHLHGNDSLAIGPHCWKEEGVAPDHVLGGALLVSRSLMKLLVPCLKSCVDRSHDNDDVEMCFDDREVGACLEHIVKIHCQPESKFSGRFVDSSGVPLSHQQLRSRSGTFSFLVTYGPVKKQDELHMLQHHYKRAELEASLATTRGLELEVNELCSSRSSSFFSPTAEDNCAADLCNHQTPSTGRCPPSGTVTKLPPDFESRTIYDYYPWQYFDVKMVYEEASTQPSFKLKLRRNLKVELQQALTRAIQKSSNAHGKPLRFKRLVNGWVRHNPFVGNEYIIDYLLVDSKKKWVSHRVNLVRPLAKNIISHIETFDTRTKIHFIVPLSKVTGRFKEFMSMYEKLVLEAEQKAELVLCVYGDDDIREVRQIVGQYQELYKDMQVKVLEGKGLFSRSRALELGFSSLSAHQLAFVCDVDMTITSTFLNRCRSNTIEGKRVYYPEFFKLYNMDYVYWNRTKPAQFRLLREHGHWAYYSFGMLCIYKSDYAKVGGFDTNIVGWGGEDVMFFHRVVRSRIKVMRAPDIALTHRWHPKECSRSLSPRQYRQCQSSRQENLADRRELARYVYQERPIRTITKSGEQDKNTPNHDKTTPNYDNTMSMHDKMSRAPSAQSGADDNIK